jgi:hypothetical protein
VLNLQSDPGVKRFKNEPTGKFDMVICVQVLGSIPKDDLPWVVDRLYGFATKVIFVAERLIIPRKQIYAKMEEDMPYGLSRGEWLKILRHQGYYVFTDDIESVPKMFFASKSKTEGWSIEEVK